MRIAVCDDEAPVLDALAGKIQTYMDGMGADCAVSKFQSGESLLADIAKSGHSFDGIYLDIKMDRINGLETAKTIRKTDPQTCIVFVSALKEYVFDAFDVDATNFLLKPIDDSKLFSTLDKIARQPDLAVDNALMIAKSGKVTKVPLRHIIYCEVLDHRLFVYESTCTHEYGGKIEDLERELNGDFFRCHRSYLVNLRFVQRYGEGFVHMAGSFKVPVATRRRQEFMQALLRFQRNEVR